MQREEGRESSAAQRGKSTVEQCMSRRLEKHSKRERKAKEHQENVQNA